MFSDKKGYPDGIKVSRRKKQSGNRIAEKKQFEEMIHVLIFSNLLKVFANDPGDLGSIPGRVITKTLKMILDTSLLNTQQYKVCINGKVEQSRERHRACPYISV